MNTIKKGSALLSVLFGCALFAGCASSDDDYIRWHSHVEDDVVHATGSE